MKQRKENVEIKVALFDHLTRCGTDGMSGGVPYVNTRDSAIDITWSRHAQCCWPTRLLVNPFGLCRRQQTRNRLWETGSLE